MRLEVLENLQHTQSIHEYIEPNQGIEYQRIF